MMQLSKNLHLRNDTYTRGKHSKDKFPALVGANCDCSGKPFLIFLSNRESQDTLKVVKASWRNMKQTLSPEWRKTRLKNICMKWVTDLLMKNNKFYFVFLTNVLHPPQISELEGVKSCLYHVIESGSSSYCPKHYLVFKRRTRERCFLIHMIKLNKNSESWQITVLKAMKGFNKHGKKCPPKVYLTGRA